jgi:phosphoenolpyruvate-protein kinase (PTS system EI component)
MIEIPSAAVTIDRLTRVSEFFSIGTNDLAQYLLAVDRGNPKVGHLYDPLHPAVLDVTARVAESCRAAGRPLSVCGELAAGGLGAAALVALGITDLSINPGALLRVRRLIQCMDAGRLREKAPLLRDADDGAAVRGILREALTRMETPESLWSE